MLTFVVSSLLVGFGVGVLSGLLGIGGGTILVALFSLAYGMTALQSTATSLFTIIPTSLSGTITHIRERTCVIGVGAAAGIGGAIMSPVGVWLATLSPEWLVLVTCAAIIAYSSATMFRKAFALRSKGKVAAASDPSSGNPSAGSEAPALSRTKLVQSGVIGLVAGLLSGYVGVGGGFLMVPLFMSVIGLPMRLTSGSSLIAVMILAIPGTITQAMMGNVVWVIGICVAIGSMPGAVLGARLVKRIPEFALRLGFASFLLVMAALLVAEQFV